MSLFYTSDPLMDFARHDREQAKWLDKQPKCDHCNRPIQDERLCDFDGTLICPKCLENHYMKYTEDYE